MEGSELKLCLSLEDDSGDIDPSTGDVQASKTAVSKGKAVMSKKKVKSFRHVYLTFCIFLKFLSPGISHEEKPEESSGERRL